MKCVILVASSPVDYYSIVELGTLWNGGTKMVVSLKHILYKVGFFLVWKLNNWGI